MSRHSYREGKRNTIIKIVAIVLLVVLAGALYYDHVRNKRLEEEWAMIAQQQLEEQRAQEEAREQLKAKDSFYQKLADGFDVNILIVGDSIGAGDGATDKAHKWANLLSQNLQKTYEVTTTLKNVSMSGNTSYAGYVRTMALDDGIDYDLVVLCYGQNDGVSNFGLYYESMIRAVKNRYPRASIISVLESSQKDYTEKMQTIQNLAQHYGIPVADTIAPFQASYDVLVKDGVHPNDDGYRVYYEQVMDVITSLVAQRRGYDPAEVPVVNSQVVNFDTFQWFDADKFTREGNTFTLTTKANGVILGIDYNINPGNNTCKILIDDVEYAAPQKTFNYDFSQRQIKIVNNWLEGDIVNIQKEIKIVFAEDEVGRKQADGFKGIAISG